MRRSKLDTPHIKEKVVKQLAAGESQNSISKEIGLNRSAVCRFANREDIRELIQQEQMKLVEVVPDAVENVQDLVREMKDIPKNDIKRRELSYKASKDVLKSVGLLPTPVQSQTFLNMYQDNRQLISPQIMEILNNKFDEITGIDEDNDLIST
jgi:predicted transcriptional regulator